MDIFYTKIQQRQQYNNRFFLILGDIIDDGQIIDILQTKNLFEL